MLICCHIERKSQSSRTIKLIQENLLFTLLRFKVRHKGNVLYDCEFSEARKHVRRKILTSLIIGENGSGKSYLLATIADFLRYVYAQKGRVSSQSSSINFKYEIAEISYIIDGSSFEIRKEKSEIFFRRNDRPIELGELRLPNRVITLSFITNDKFAFSSDLDGFYSYLGIRAAGNATYTSTIEKRLCSHFSSIAKSESRIKKLAHILDFLDIEKRIAIRHSLKRKTLFRSEPSHETIEKALKKAVLRKRYLSFNLRSISPEEIDRLLENLRRLKSRYSTKIGAVEYEVDVNSSEMKIESDELIALNILESIEFVSPPSAVFTKKDGFGFEHTSSGEKNILYTMTSLLSAIAPDSLVLIDEPEISLHPSWQMRYVHLLKTVLGDHSDGHCVLATHSHFMVSDIEPEDSDLVTVSSQFDGEKISRSFKKLEHSTYAWSAESILYQVFNLRTTRNYYFERELTELLEMVANRSSNIGRISELVSKFSSLAFDENDPINIVIEQSQEYLATYDKAN